MAWTYSQSTGQLRYNGKLVDTGYSGAGSSSTSGRNNPAMQNVRFHGPIPQGTWSIGRAFDHKSKGPTVMALTPIGHDAFGRTGFLIHGDNQKTHAASEGCIILGPTARHQIDKSGDTSLTVVP